MVGLLSGAPVPPYDELPPVVRLLLRLVLLLLRRSVPVPSVVVPETGRVSTWTPHLPGDRSRGGGPSLSVTKLLGQ